MFGQPERPPFCTRVGAIDEALCQVDLAAVPKVQCKRDEYLLDDSPLHPRLEAPMNRLIGRVATRKVGPLSPRAEDPQDAVHHRARVLPRATTLARWTALTGWDVGLDDCPLLV